MRAAFIQALCDLAKSDNRIFLLTGDLGYRYLEKFAESYPDRFVNVGVAESNLINVAAGLSKIGFIPFAYSIATFVTMRPFEAIRSVVSLQNLNVKIVGTGGGLAYHKAGSTHHSMEDIALMRLLPNMTIVVPSDQNDAYDCVFELTKKGGPAYLRLERNPDQKIEIPKFKLGLARVIIKGKKLSIIVTGTKVAQAVQIAGILKKKNIYPTIVVMSTINPIDKKLLKQIATSHNLIVTIEEHRLTGGLGSAVLEEILNIDLKYHPAVYRFGLKNNFTPISAGYNKLIQYHQFTPLHISRKILSLYQSLS